MPMGEPMKYIHSHHKNGSLFVFSVRQSVVGHLARLRHWDIPSVHKSPPSRLSLSFFLSLTLPLSSSLRVFHGASCEIYFQIYCCEMYCVSSCFEEGFTPR